MIAAVADTPAAGETRNAAASERPSQKLCRASAARLMAAVACMGRVRRRIASRRANERTDNRSGNWGEERVCGSTWVVRSERRAPAANGNRWWRCGVRGRRGSDISVIDDVSREAVSAAFSTGSECKGDRSVLKVAARRSVSAVIRGCRAFV